MTEPFPKHALVLRACIKSLLKALWKKDKFILFTQCFLPVKKEEVSRIFYQI